MSAIELRDILTYHRQLAEKLRHDAAHPHTPQDAEICAWETRYHEEKIRQIEGVAPALVEDGFSYPL